MEILKSCAAWGDWHPQVPRGMVVIAAESGDRVRAFVVPRAEYSKGMRFDPAKFRELPGFDRVQGHQATQATSSPSTARLAVAPQSDFGWGKIVKELNGAAPENAPGAEPTQQNPGVAKPWRQIINSIEGRS